MRCFVCVYARLCRKFDTHFAGFETGNLCMKRQLEDALSLVCARVAHANLMSVLQVFRSGQSCMEQQPHTAPSVAIGRSGGDRACDADTHS